MNAKKQILSSPCIICGKSSVAHLYKGKDRIHFLKGEFDLYRCEACQLIFIFPVPGNGELGQFYPQNYYSYGEVQNTDQKPTGSKFAYYALRPLKAINALVYSKLLQQNREIHLKPHSRVLDIGCGNGRYLLQKKNEKCDVFGVDIDKMTLERLGKQHPDVKVFCGNLWDAHFASDYFDLIHVSHVLEHIPELNLLIKEICRILKKGGLIHIQVPNSFSLTHWLFRECWLGLDVPRHLYTFNQKNLLNFFEQHKLKAVRIRTNENNFSFLGSLLFFLNERFRKKIGLFDTNYYWDSEILKLLFVPYCIFVNLFRIGDTMELILKKHETI